jgi:hypothetical protein
MEIISVFAIPVLFGVACYVLEFIWEVLDPLDD